MKNYILVNGEPQAVDDVLEWARWFETSDNERVIARESQNDVTISTVFLGLDHNFNGGVPILYETMVFGGEHDQEMRRYHTAEEAGIGHREMVQQVFGQ